MDDGAADRVKERLARTPPRRILLLVHPNIGNTVNLTSVARWLKAAWPDARIVGCGGRVPAPLLEACPYVDEVWIRPEGAWDQLRFVHTLRAGKFDLSVHCQGQNTLLRLVKAAGVPIRIGVRGSKHAAWLDAGVAWKDGEVEQPGTVGRLLSLLGMDCSDQSAAVVIPEAARRAAECLDEGGPLVAFMTGASHPAKRWPLSRFRSVIDLLPEGCRPILVGGPDERGHAREIGAKRLLDLTGRLSVLETMAVLERCHVLVTNDSGPMHLAAAVGTPVVAVFGPTSGTRFAPHGADHHVLQGTCDCPLRSLEACTGACLHSLEAEAVFERVATLVRATVRPS